MKKGQSKTYFQYQKNFPIVRITDRELKKYGISVFDVKLEGKILCK